MQMLNENAKQADVEYHIHRFGSEPHDLQIRVGLQSFNLHRSIAMTRSKYLTDLLNKKPPAAVMDLVLDDVNTSAFLDICRWMYGSHLEIAAHNFCTVWNAAKKLQILDVVDKCRQYLSSIGSQHRSCHNQQRKIQETARRIRVQPQQNATKAVTFAPMTALTSRLPPTNISEQDSGSKRTLRTKPISLEKLSRKVVSGNRAVAQPASTVSNEWLTISAEEVIGSRHEDLVPSILRGKTGMQGMSFRVSRTYEEMAVGLELSADPQSDDKLQTCPSVSPEMVIVKTCKLPKLAFLVARSHLVLKSAHLRRELETSGSNCVTLCHTDNQTVSNVLQWSLGECLPPTYNARATLQLTCHLQMTDLATKSLELWRKCIRDYLEIMPAEVGSAALVACLRSNWPLVGPYPFLINLVVSRLQRPAKDISRAISGTRENLKGACGHSKIVRKMLTGHNPCPEKTFTIPRSERAKVEVVASVPSPTKPASQGAVRILGLRRTLELLNSRKTHSKHPFSKSNKSGTEPAKSVASTTQAGAHSHNDGKISPKPEASQKTASSTKIFTAPRQDDIHKRTSLKKE